MPHDLDAESHDIVIPTALPAAHVLVSASFVETLSTLEIQVQTLKITSAEDAQAAVEMQRRLTKAGTALESARNDILRPLRSITEQVNQAAQQVNARIELAKRSLKAQINTYDEAQRRLAAEAERKRLEEIRKKEEERQAEIRRLEDLRRKEQEEANARARALLEQQRREQEERDQRAAEAQRAPAPTPPPAPAPAENDLDLASEAPPPVETELSRQIVNLRHAPITVPPVVAPAPKLQGVQFRTWVEIVSVDPRQLPDHFVIRTPDTKALRAAYIATWKEGEPLPACPGVVFDIRREPITR